MAAKIRCYEYNWACAKMKRDAAQVFRSPNITAGGSSPTSRSIYSDKANEASKEARGLLQKVVTDHPGTPWALLAQRELKDPMGLKWTEVTVPPTPKRNPAEAKKKEAPKMPAKPEERPKL